VGSSGEESYMIICVCGEACECVSDSVCEQEARVVSERVYAGLSSEKRSLCQVLPVTLPLLLSKVVEHRSYPRCQES
jgi:hypothetical protein